MALIIEDGSIVVNADSYVTTAELTTYAAKRNYTVTAVPAELEVLLIKAMDYLASLESRYKGDRVNNIQELSFPRIGVQLHGYWLDSDVIPQDLKNAQMELAFQVSTDEILVNETTSNLESFDVKGVYSESYGSGGDGSSVKARKANAYLTNLLKKAGTLVRA